MPITIAKLREYSSSKEAWQSLWDDLTRRASGAEGAVYLIEKLSIELTETFMQLEDELELLAAAPPELSAIKPLKVNSRYVIVDRFKGRVAVRKYEDGELVVIDRDFILLHVSYIFYLSRQKSYGPVLAAWMLIHSTITTPGKPFPLLEAYYLFALKSNPGLIGELIRCIGTFILAHELGHKYIQKHDLSFLRVSTISVYEAKEEMERIREFRIHPDGVIYNILLDGIEPPLLLLDPESKHWLEEMGADIYACYLQLLSYRDNHEDGLHKLIHHLIVWQQLIRVFQFRQHAEGAGLGSGLSHPPSTVRIDSLVHHIEKLALEFFPAFQSESISILQRQYSVTWSRDIFDTWRDVYTYVFYTLDSERLPESIPVDMVPSFSSDGVPYSPGMFDRFLREYAANAFNLRRSKDEDGIEELWSKELPEYSATFRMNGRSVLLELARHLENIGLAFE